uniref:Reverse transcriptase Ty1/copia-type domain-containing protein n=1 Tax=Solanum lycopersicum TaxID=4081 RepID=A0A3Q7FJI4_SOLLC
MERNIDQEPAPQIPVQNLASNQIPVQNLAARTSTVAHGSHDNYKGKGPEGSEGRCALDMRNTTITKQQIDQLVGVSLVFVVVYVDDIILTGTDVNEIRSLKSFLHDQFKIKDLGKLHYFLGLEILYKDTGVLISQRKFTTDLLKEFDCTSCKPSMSPLEPTVKFKANEGALLKDPTFYRKLVGKLNFLTNTRLDITFSVQHLSQFLQSPREPHLKAAYHVLRYLMNDPCLGVFLSNSTDCTITAYCDSDWAACPDSRRSVSGYIVLMGDSPICWKSKKQATISLSSAEAEYRAIRKVVGELVWLEKLLTELHSPCNLPLAD